MSDYVLVSFKNEGVDLKLSVTYTAGELLAILTGLYGVRGGDIRVEPAGIILNKNKTLIDQKIEHGSVIEVV